MKFRVLPILVAAAFGLCLATHGAVVFRPGNKAKYVPPGEEEFNGNAAELFQAAQKAEKDGDLNKAIKVYKTLVRKYPHDALSADACYRGGLLYEQLHEYLEAAGTYQTLVVAFPKSPHFNDAIEALFRIGEMYLAGKKLKLLGIPLATSMDRAVEIFAGVIRTAPYGKYTARAQFDIGLAREKQGANDAAVQAYQAVIDKFPNDPVAGDAQYQIGYIWMTAAKGGTQDLAATNNARTAFQDYLFRYPNTEKASQARANLQQLEDRSTNRSFDVAKYYDKQKAYRAAVIYYNEVIRQQPGSAESEKARKRIEELRKKVGEKALQSAAELEPKKADEQNKAKAGASGANPPPGLNSAPMLPPDLDSSLPPSPSSSSSSLGGGSSSSLGEPTDSATPEPSSTPDAVPDQTPQESATPSQPDNASSAEAAASPTP